MQRWNIVGVLVNVDPTCCAVPLAVETSISILVLLRCSFFTNSIKSCVALCHLQRVSAAACEVREFVHLDFQVLNNFIDMNVDF
jgi:hypothetical protein